MKDLDNCTHIAKDFKAGKEFNLKEETEKWADKWIHKKLTGRAYKELRDIEKEFIKLLEEEMCLDDGEGVCGIYGGNKTNICNNCKKINKLAGEKLVKCEPIAQSGRALV